MIQPQPATYYKQQGITSIFVVVFAALLFSVIMISFAGLMNREQQRSTDDELSQSAYDSALAGVEDAKRVIMLSRAGDTAAKDAIAANACNTIPAAGIAGGDPSADEVLVQSSSAGDGSELNQAYTCVKISFNSPDYEANLTTAMKSTVVPLRGAGEFDRVKIEWHQAQGVGIDTICGGSLGASADALCPLADWGSQATAPAMLRVQTITPGTSYSLGDLNEAGAGNSVFLYPSDILSAINLASRDRFVDGGTTSGTANSPQQAICAINPIVDEYHCSAIVELGRDMPPTETNALLRLTALYHPTFVRVTLLNGSDAVDFAGAQPVVDSTGRANDLFRRVRARLNLAADYVYPENALDIAGSLCKDFYVTNTIANRSAAGCDP